MKRTPRPTSPEASRLRQRKGVLTRRFAIPEDLLPGSLTETRRRCGKPTCHCARGEGHPMWRLTFMVEGQKRVERIPLEWVEAVRQLVDAGREFKEAVNEVLAANAQLWVLWRREQGR